MCAACMWLVPRGRIETQLAAVLRTPNYFLAPIAQNVSLERWISLRVIVVGLPAEERRPSVNDRRCVLRQRKKHVLNRLVLRHVWEESEALKKERTVAQFLAARG
jgi:hypothetical protein